ncbi:MAG: 16S rRNA (cytidine(1402)-2'-O)-methyltransferase [Gammaproteobacteria bacterium]|jgi:16S rRNA (cytidine1402-2'-O)-methyltransferase
MSGVLYIVATPIGNLDDISLRAIEVLREVALIAAEDTRHSGMLLKHLGIDTPMISCHQHNEQKRSQEIIARLESGDDVALISDAGTPLISDPGYRLVQAARHRQIRVSPIPGANSAIAALSAAGLPTERFHFCGFLSSRAAEREAQLRDLESLDATLVLFESGHRILRLLDQIDSVFGDRPCVVAKELTKLHERFLEGSAAELRLRFDADSQLVKGEFVVLIDNTEATGENSLEGADIELLSILLDELNLRTAVRIATRLTGKSKNEIYQKALKLCASDPE